MITDACAVSVCNGRTRELQIIDRYIAVRDKDGFAVWNTCRAYKMRHSANAFDSDVRIYLRKVVDVCTSLNLDRIPIMRGADGCR